MTKTALRQNTLFFMINSAVRAYRFPDSDGLPASAGSLLEFPARFYLISLMFEMGCFPSAHFPICRTISRAEWRDWRIGARIKAGGRHIWAEGRRQRTGALSKTWRSQDESGQRDSVLRSGSPADFRAP